MTEKIEYKINIDIIIITSELSIRKVTNDSRK